VVSKWASTAHAAHECRIRWCAHTLSYRVLQCRCIFVAAGMHAHSFHLLECWRFRKHEQQHACELCAVCALHSARCVCTMTGPQGVQKVQWVVWDRLASGRSAYTVCEQHHAPQVLSNLVKATQPAVPNIAFTAFARVGSRQPVGMTSVTAAGVCAEPGVVLRLVCSGGDAVGANIRCLLSLSTAPG
jgi:hypothetical protein